ncbi:hypothetical protein F511_37019 [Dorcoceras hygrometricum]|uniref:Uncharacterized protein n=1 Tax=Dorcoceras hygrometricum TaxID=472368 RepID=A0A2Z7B978_9LAMI|nr:hypothetical protein F511_37019 [Dorcoceras hygrometricum]
MPPRRTKARGTEENSNTESTTQGSENSTLTHAQIAELVATTVAQILAGQPAPQPPPNLDQQVGEIRRMREELETRQAEEMRRMREELESQRVEEMRRMYEELENLRTERNSAPPPPPAREVPFSTEVLDADLPQHFKYHNVGEYDGMGDPEEHLSRFENAALLHLCCCGSLLLGLL